MNQYNKLVARLESDYTTAQKTRARECKELDEAEEEVEATVEVQQVLQSLAATVQQQAHRRIASVVSRCLETVFEEDAYEFKINFEEKRGKTEARLLFCRDGLEVEPLEAAGGGVVDVAAFALRLACLVLQRPVRRRLLVLDEPFRFVSKSYRPRLKSLLLSLANEFNVQFIMVTHIPDLMTGKVVEL
jgi:DNA repair exonuclease SbcCD ATPase subunit